MTAVADDQSLLGKVRTFMADGQWHTLDELELRFGHLIPPEMAYRRALGQRRAHQKREPNRPWQTQMTETDFIQAGRRRAMSQALTRAPGIETKRLSGSSYQYRFNLELAKTQMRTCVICGSLFLPADLMSYGQTCSTRCTALLSNRTRRAKEGVQPT